MDILRLLGLLDGAASIVTGFNRPNLHLNVCYTSGERGKPGALKELANSHPDGATLKEITGLLRKHGAAGVHVLTLTRTIHSDQ